jgi:hypothetical protein
VTADPFRDEVAIDFPSSGRFLERVRETFVSESAACREEIVHAQVLVSTEDAHRGTTLPLDLSVRATCSSCGGRGETWAEVCSACGGSGDALVSCHLSVPVPAGIADGARLNLRVRAPHASPVRLEVRVAVRHMRL